MGRLAALRQWVSDTFSALVELGGGEIATARVYGPAGDESVPVPEDHAIAIRVPGVGQIVVVGWRDTDLEPKAQVGERRFYARSPGDGSQPSEEVSEIWMKNDGTVAASAKKQFDFVTESGAELHLAEDGSVTAKTAAGAQVVLSGATASIGNAAGSVAIAADGTVTINGATISPTGAITAPAVTGGGVPLATHTHSVGTLVADPSTGVITGASGGPA